MKKLLVILLAAMMVLSLAAVSMAAPTVGGELKLVYTIADEDPDDGNKQNDITDNAEAKVTFSTKVSDSVTGFVAVKAGSGAGSNFVADEYHITIAQDFGQFKLGYFGKSLTPDLDIIKAFGSVKELKANVLAEGTFNIADGFTLGVDYALDGNADVVGGVWKPAKLGDIPEIYDGAYVLSLAYAADSFGGAVNFFGNDAKNDGEYKNITALDVWYQPVDMLKAYVAYVDASQKKAAGDKDPKASIIIGAYADFTDALYGRFEYNLEDYKAKSNNYGIKLGYKFANGITAEAKAVKNFDGTMPIELSMKVAL
jgi:hypothetical protein